MLVTLLKFPKGNWSIQCIGVDSQWLERNAGTDRSLARSMGFDHYVAKPYDPSAVLALLASVRSASQ